MMLPEKEDAPLIGIGKRGRGWSKAYVDAVLPAPLRPYIPVIAVVMVLLYVLDMQFARHHTPTTTSSAPPPATLGEASVRRGTVAKEFPLAAGERFQFVPKDGSVNYADCDGVYKVVKGEDSQMNGKPYYMNKAKQRFLAWNGKVWEITATHYLQGLQNHHKEHGFYPGSFGGFHSGGGASPAEGSWAAYTVGTLTPQDAPAAFKVFGAAQGSAVAPKAAGVYVATGNMASGRPTYKDAEDRVLVFSGTEWSITGAHILSALPAKAVGAWPDEASWVGGVDVAEVVAPTTPQKPHPPGTPATQRHHRSFKLVLKPDGVNAGNCDGTYVVAEGAESQIEGKPFYLNKEKQRVLCATGSTWMIVALGALPQLLKDAASGAKGTLAAKVFHKGGAASAPDEGFWESFTVAGDSPRAFLFKARPDGSNYGNCDGLYNAADGEDAEINGKPYFVNSEKERFLAWNGETWELTAMYFLPSVLKHHREHGFWPGRFGGYHAGGGDWPADQPWDDYFVTDDEPVLVDQRKAFRFKRRGEDNYGECDGVYKVAVGADAEINGKPYYVHLDRPRFLAWNGQTWEISASEYLPGIQQHQLNHGFWPGTFGGYHYGGEGRPDDGAWSDYWVSAEQPSAFVFKTASGRNYAKCDGRYDAALPSEEGQINGKPYYVNTAGHRFLAWTGVIWEITATDYLAGILQHHSTHGFWPGSFGGYHSGGGEQPDEGKWADYSVEAKYDGYT